MSVYPDAPGWKLTSTSREAAESVSTECGRLQKWALAAIKKAGSHGLTADECAEALGMSRWSIQPRVSECRRKGLVMDSGQRRKNGSGRSAIVWVAATFGELPQ